jgi:hypothetical protein
MMGSPCRDFRERLLGKAYSLVERSAGYRRLQDWSNGVECTYESELTTDVVVTAYRA